MSGRSPPSSSAGRSPRRDSARAAAASLPGADPFNPRTPPALIELLRNSNPWIAAADTDHHGYGLVRADDDSLTCRLRIVSGIKRRSRSMLPDLRFVVRPGEPSILDQAPD